MVSSMRIDRMFLCSLTLLEMTLHVNVCVITQHDIRNVVISVFLLSLSTCFCHFCTPSLTWFHLHYFGGVCVSVKAICCCCEEKLLPISINLSCCAVDPGKRFECHLLGKNCKCNLREHLQRQFKIWQILWWTHIAVFHFLQKIANTILTWCYWIQC